MLALFIVIAGLFLFTAIQFNRYSRLKDKFYGLLLINEDLGHKSQALNQENKRMERIIQNIEISSLKQWEEFDEIYQSNSELADEILQHLREIPSEKKENRLLSGLLLMQKGKFREASMEFSKISESDLYQPLICYEMAKAYLELNDLKKAKILLQKTVNLKGNEFSSLKMLGYIALEEQDYPEAIKYFSELLQRYPRSSYVHNWLGYAQLKAREYRKAIEILEEGARIQDAPAELFNNLGVCYESIQSYGNALRNYEIANTKKANYATKSLERVKIPIPIWPAQNP